jgi:hypothetical protein
MQEADPTMPHHATLGGFPGPVVLASAPQKKRPGEDDGPLDDELDDDELGDFELEEDEEDLDDDEIEDWGEDEDEDEEDDL